MERIRKNYKQKDTDMTFIESDQRMGQQLADLDKLQRQDHEHLMQVKYLSQTISDDLKELKDGASTRLLQLETEVRDLKQWRRDFSLTWKLIVGIASGVGAVIGFILSLVSNIYNLFGK